MRTAIRLFWAVAVLAPAWVTAAAQSSAPQVIGTQQINRFEAIRQLQETVKQNPKSLADWVILGELAHEVAIDLPADQAGEYYKLSREAYENALELCPTTAGCRRPFSSPRTRSKASNASRNLAPRRRGCIWRPVAATWPRPSSPPRSASSGRRLPPPRP